MDAVREKENTFFFAFLKILDEIPFNEGQITRTKKNQKFKNVYTSCVHERDPGKLSNSLQWPKPSP